jgi:predicted Zn-ribbon and HTH transcriptional regulator
MTTKTTQPTPLLVTRVRCRACEHVWVSRKPFVPIRCPNCAKRKTAEPIESDGVL